MTPDERARKIVETMNEAHRIAMSGRQWAAVRTLTETAIREAESAAYERAAATLDNPLTSGGFSLEWVCGFAEGQKQSADVIRNLKSKRDGGRA